MKYICQKCGKEFEHNRKRKYCFDCKPSPKKYTSLEEKKTARRKQLVANVTRRRKKIKQKAIDYKGGKCIVCGYDKCNAALQFHHLDPTKKDFGISSNGITRSWERVKKELDKCVLVCANCHEEIHSGLIDIQDYIDLDSI